MRGSGPARAGAGLCRGRAAGRPGCAGVRGPGPSARAARTQTPAPRSLSAGPADRGVADAGHTPGAARLDGAWPRRLAPSCVGSTRRKSPSSKGKTACSAGYAMRQAGWRVCLRRADRRGRVPRLCIGQRSDRAAAGHADPLLTLERLRRLLLGEFSDHRVLTQATASTAAPGSESESEENFQTGLRARSKATRSTPPLWQSVGIGRQRKEANGAK